MSIYTGVGSRKTPSDILDLMFAYAAKRASEGWILRSGGADKADTAFWEGYLSVKGEDLESAEIYLPWKGFNDFTYPCGIIGPWFPSWAEAEKIAESVIPYWDKLKRSHKALHTRNVYQILGINLDTPSDVVVLYAEPTQKVFNGTLKGGTNTAYQLALKYEVPTLNLYFEDQLAEVKRYLDGEGNDA